MPRPRSHCRWAGCRAGCARVASPPAPLVNAAHVARPAACRDGQRLGGIAAQRDHPAVRAPVRDAGSRGTGAREPGRGAALAGHVHQSLRPRARRRRRRACSSASASRCELPDRGAVLRPDLGHHRPARPARPGARPHAGRPQPWLDDGRADRGARAELHRGVHRRRPPNCCRPRDADAHRRGLDAHARRGAGRARAGLDAAGLAGGAGDRRSSTATSTPTWATTPTARAAPRRASRPRCSTPGAAGSPATSASSRGTTRSRWPARSGACCPAVRAADADTAVLADGFSCRTQIGQLDDTGHEPVHLAHLAATALGLRSRERTSGSGHGRALTGP